MKSRWCCMLLFGLFCVGCSKPTPPETSKAKKPSSSTPSRRAPGPASAQRAAFNSNGESLSNSSGVDQLFIQDLQNSNAEKVKDAIEHLQNNGVKSAIPKLEEVAKNNKNPDLRKRAQNAVDSLKKRK